MTFGDAITMTNEILRSVFFRLLQTSFTFRLDFYAIVAVGLVLIISTFVLIRYHFLNVYSRLPPKLQRDESFIRLYSRNEDIEESYSAANSIEDFVSSVKIFRYLEKSLSHGLTRNMKTRNIQAGESLYLEEEDAYCVVVDGCIEVYYKGKSDPSDEYRLLTEVRNGSSISSFFSIISLFLESDKTDEKHDIFPYHILANAKEDTVIAAIPAQDFRNLMKSSPENIAQLIHIIISRFQRVTLSTAFNYLGLKDEILALESNLTGNFHCFLPELITSGSLQSFNAETSDSSPVQLLTAGQCFYNHLNEKPESIESLEQAILDASFTCFMQAFMGSNDFINDNSHSGKHDDDPCSEHNFKILGSEYQERNSYDFSDYSFKEAQSNQNLEGTSSYMTINRYKKGSCLIEQFSIDCGLYLVLDGFLEASIDTSNDDLKNNNKITFLIKPGNFAGYMSAFCNSKNLLQYRARSDCIVAHISRSSIERLIDRYPKASITFAKRISNSITPMIIQLDFALEWVQASSGHAIYRRGDRADGIYLILKGRTRQCFESAQSDKTISHFESGAGESIGEIESLTGIPRQATYFAIRDTELVRLPSVMVNSFTSKYPAISSQISRGLAMRMGNMLQINGPKLMQSAGQSTAKSKTIALIPHNTSIPIVFFASRLKDALQKQNNSVRLLSHAVIVRRLGKHVFTEMGRLKFVSYLTDLEEKYDIILYVANSNASSQWTKTCVDQADKIFVVAQEDADAQISDYERTIITQRTRAKKELILLHIDRFCPQGLTRKWLQDRLWISGHHHVQMDYKMDDNDVSDIKLSTTPLSALTRKMKLLQSGLNAYKVTRVEAQNKQVISKMDDFARLARHITGNSIGLVLGGGGARGISSIGIIIALEEAGIPIDIVGGTSIGSFTGALYAQEAVSLPLYARAKKFCGRLASTWRYVLDVTYPALAYTTGHEFNRSVWKVFRNAQIEDFWLPFYTNTTNVSQQKMNIHNSGYAWRYIRASMSLAGLVPPLTEEGELLLDGGYMDNLTVDHMTSLGAKYIIAIDVGSKELRYKIDYGDSISGLGVIANRMNIWSSCPKIPNIAEIQARLAYVSSVSKLEIAKTLPNCFYLRPPIDKFQTLEFKKFDEIFQVGYAHGKKEIPRLLENRGFASLFARDNDNTIKSIASQTELRRNFSL